MRISDWSSDVVLFRSVQVRYTGPQIDRNALLRYVVSLRRHTEFHEHCVEKMYCDIWQACKPQSLLVYARYTRRGESGRASCRERVCQYVEISVVAVASKKEMNNKKETD